MDDRLNYIQRPVAILDKRTKNMHNKEVDHVKVWWKHRNGSEWTWEPEDEMREHFPELIAATDFEDGV